jgi:hypothetical protein
MLSHLYAGRKIDALDGLLLPPLPPADSAADRLGARLPAFYVRFVVPPKEPGIRALLHTGQLYWRAADFDRAAMRAFQEPMPRSEDTTFYLALALALRGGPENAAAMMRKPPSDRLGIGDTAALDVVARGSGPLAPLAAFDAAFLKRVAAPRAPDPAYWRDVAARFNASAPRLSGAEAARALELAKEAQAIEAEVAKPSQ